jgi:hypothetical protein
LVCLVVFAFFWNNKRFAEVVSVHIGFVWAAP